MTHDRTRISALVDGECSVDERDAVLAHVMGCDDCRVFYQQERAAKAALAAGSASGQTAPTSLVSSLLALAASSPTPQRPAPRPARASGPARPVELPGQRRRRIRRAAKGIGLSFLGASLLIAAAFVIGGDSRGRVATPAIAAFGADHARAGAQTLSGDVSLATVTSSSTGLAAGADLVLTRSLAAPTTLAGFTLLSTSPTEVGATRSTYAADGTSISVFRQDGRLDTSALEGFRTHKVDGVKLKRKVGEPTYLVWSCEDVTYTVVGEAAGDLDRVAKALPHACARTDGWSRVGRGMHRAAGWLNPLS